ncbi:PD-(D/E)XK nuclease family protein [Halorubrum aethiopicum]|uniref:PD-(D/E)XK nuclease family protein n=1 Tax=Halorubrum aethiopicum TaxID=1758255 RepID=UPI0009B5BB45
MAAGVDPNAFLESLPVDVEAVEPDGDDEENVKALIDSLNGEKRAEIDAFLPLSVDGERVTIGGVIDLLHLTPDRAEIVDYKTDLTRHAEAEYEKQLSVYYRVVEGVHPDREVSASIFYTRDGERREIESLDEDELRDLVRTHCE